MPEEEPVCDCEGGEPPDPEPGCGEGEEITCPPGYESCGATGGTFIVDSDVEWSWVNNNGCPEGCIAFKAEQPTAEEEAAGVAPGDLSYDGICCITCNNVFLLCEGFFVNEPGWQPPPPPYTWILEPNAPNNSGNPGCTCPIGSPCNNYGEVQEEPCYYNPANQLAFKEEPCSQEECEAHVSTWMAEPSGEPNEEGLYKVNWVLLDGCPGLCCSDQPTQPEFVKTSIIVDAPCKCGCA